MPIGRAVEASAGQQYSRSGITPCQEWLLVTLLQTQSDATRTGGVGMCGF